MKIAVAGATGTAGVPTVRAIEQAGHECVPLSRKDGFDLHSGASLAEALEGISVVIDTSNPFPADPGQDLVEALSGATRNLIRACQTSGVEHLVFLSICNIDNSVFDQFPYYVAKRAQENEIRATELSTTIVRSTQWHQFATNPNAVRFADNEVEVEDWLIQPIDVETVADVLLQAASERPEWCHISGPETIRLPELTAAFLRAHTDSRAVRAVSPSLPELKEGVLLAPPEAYRLGPTVQSWINTQRAS